MGTYDGGRLAVGHRRIRSRPDLRSTRVTPRLPTTLDRDIDTLLACSRLAPFARPVGRDFWRQRGSTRLSARQPWRRARRDCVAGGRAVGNFYKIELFIDWKQFRP
jgi:hypothetical protein